MPVERLLGGQNLDEAAAKRVEPVRLADVPVQADGVELRQHIDPVQAAVDAVRHRDIDQAVLARQRHGRLGPVQSQRQQARAASTLPTQMSRHFA